MATVKIDAPVPFGLPVLAAPTGTEWIPMDVPIAGTSPPTAITMRATSQTIANLFASSGNIVGTANEIQVTSAGGVVTIGFSPNIVIPAPASGTALTVDSVAGNWAQNISGVNTTGQSFGLTIFAGTNASDIALNVVNAANTQQLGKINGDGSGVLGYNGTSNTIAWTSAGNVTINAPSSGDALTANGLNTAWAATINGANGSAGNGLRVVGDFTGPGTASLVQFTDPNNTNGVNLQLTGNGATTPSKFIRVNGGQLQIINSAYTANLLTLTDAGNLTLGAASGITLSVAGVTGQSAAIFTTPSDRQVSINAAGTGQFSTLEFSQNGVITGQLFSDNTNGFMEITVNNAGAGGIKFSQGTGPIVGQGPIAATFVDMTPDRGTFTLTHTGFTTGVTSTATWYRIGKLVTLNTGSVSGTSNATTWTATGLPVGLQTSLGQTIGLADMEDNGAAVFGNVALTASSSTLTFGKGANSGGAWTNPGGKGFFNTGGTTFSYLTG